MGSSKYQTPKKKKKKSNVSAAGIRKGAGPSFLARKGFGGECSQADQG